jgi:hypothetical protein
MTPPCCRPRTYHRGTLAGVAKTPLSLGELSHFWSPKGGAEPTRSQAKVLARRRAHVSDRRRPSKIETSVMPRGRFGSNGEPRPGRPACRFYPREQTWHRFPGYIPGSQSGFQIQHLVSIVRSRSLITCAFDGRSAWGSVKCVLLLSWRCAPRWAVAPRPNRRWSRD